MTLGRYTMTRGARASTLPDGIRQDTRKHTRHCLRPTPELVALALAHPSHDTFARFRSGYLALLDQRWNDDRQPFDALVELARSEAVWLGCSCPTRQQPDVSRCHTSLALGWLSGRYPVEVVWP